MQKICLSLIAISTLILLGMCMKANAALEEENIQLQSQVVACQLTLTQMKEEQEEEMQEEPMSYIPAPILRYDSIVLTDADITYAALCAYHEARGESFEGIRAVVEVILNRVLSPEWPNTVEGVIFQQGQFDCASYLTSADIKEPALLTVCYDAVNYVLHNDDYVLDIDYGYFKSTPYASCSYRQIGNHYFAKM